jgi:hypothetical protein
MDGNNGSKKKKKKTAARKDLDKKQTAFRTLSRDDEQTAEKTAVELLLRIGDKITLVE